MKLQQMKPVKIFLYFLTILVGISSVSVDLLGLSLVVSFKIISLAKKKKRNDLLIPGA